MTKQSPTPRPVPAFLLQPWLEAAAIGLGFCNAALELQQANALFPDLLGLPSAPVQGQDLFALLQLQERQQAAARGELERGQPWQGLQKLNDRALKIEIRPTQETAHVPASGFVVTVIDYSTELDHLQQLTEAKNLAEKSDQAKSRFLSHMSHELRTPLNAIIGFTQLLKISPSLNEVEMDNLAEIETAGSHLLSLINEILDLSRIEAGKLRLSEEHVDLAALVQECLTLVQPLSNARDIRLMPQVAANSLLLADHVRLKQILLNLLSNAIKYNIAGGEVRLHSTHPDANLLRIEIADSGAGIDPRKLASIFSPFERLGAEDRDIGDTGIGLMITRRLVRLMQGEIGVLSLPERGSVFWVEFPQGRLSAPDSVLSLAEFNEMPKDQCRMPLLWIGARCGLLEAFEQLQTLRPLVVHSFRDLRSARESLLQQLSEPVARLRGPVLVTAKIAAELGRENGLTNVLKCAQVRVVKDSEDCPQAAQQEKGETPASLAESSKLTSLLNLLDSFLSAV
jgi:signal transduction histidine kinase